MSAAARLRPHLQDIRAELLRIRRPWVPDLLEHLDASMNASGGRADAARQRTAERSAAKEARIRAAIGALPLDRELRELTGIVERRMKYAPEGAPARKTIRRVLQAMQKSGSSEPKFPAGTATVPRN